MGKPKLIIISGPTASGKTTAAIQLCKRIGGEVISADSMQLYRGMDIGTAKPTIEEMDGVPHHLLDIADPIERYSVAAYREQAMLAIDEVYNRGKQPVLCGGTGLYIDALTRPMGFAAQAGNEDLRSELTAIAETDGGKERLHQMLESVDPETARRLHINDVRRVVRAIEVYRLTGRTLSAQSQADQQQEGRFQVKMFALNWPRTELYERINRRVDIMIEQGLVREVQHLMEQGFSENGTAMQALGYKEVIAALKGEISLDEAKELIKKGSRNYAKRQMTWFRRDRRVHWIEASGKTTEQIVNEMMKEILPNA